MKWYPWLRDSYQCLVASHQAARAHHALLLHSLPGMGEQSLIYALNRWLMCQQRNGQKSCGHCRSCQLMQAQTHPDFYLLQPETGKSTLGIDAIRKLTNSLYEYANMGGAKLVCLPCAEQLSEAAANALLKTLEEPPDNTWFHLVCHQPQRLPVTLRSRCIDWHLPAPATEQALAWLYQQLAQQQSIQQQSIQQQSIQEQSIQQQSTQQQVQAALRLSGGAPLAALALLQPQTAALRQQLCHSLSQLLNQHQYYSLLPQLQQENSTQYLHWLASLLLDALKYQQNLHRWLVNIDQQPLIQQLAAGQSVPLLNWLIQAIFNCVGHLQNVAGVNRELLLAELLLNWQIYQQPGAKIPPVTPDSLW